MGRLSFPPCSYPLCPADLLEARRPLAHERLGEALRVMRQVISKYPLLNTLETLTAAGTLIAKIKGSWPGQGSDGFLKEGMCEVGLEGCIGVQWAQQLQCSSFS